MVHLQHTYPQDLIISLATGGYKTTNRRYDRPTLEKTGVVLYYAKR